ncbi:energy transducer TonB [Candidatus Methylobacter oryzae]|nr:energy transducer TonB [Candidatus Methylobacter oryzae]
MFTKMMFPAINTCLLEPHQKTRLGNLHYGSVTHDNDRPWLALGLVLCAHLAVFAALSRQDQPLPVQTPPEPITVSLVSAPQPVQPKTTPVVQPTAKPQPVIKKPVKSQPVAKPVVKQAKQTIAPPVQQTAEPVVASAADAPAAKQENKISDSKPAEPQPYQSPSFNAAYLNNPAPSYPPVSRRLGEEGVVLLQVQVNTDGAPESVQLQTGSGSSRLDQAALEAVKNWRFTPAKRGNQPVSASVVVPVRFSLEG